MPYGDGTGPFGEGPMTGRGMGPCARDPVLRRRFARIRDFDRANYYRGFRSRFCLRWPVQSYEDVELTKEQEKKILKEELKELELEKQEIEKRLKEIK